MRDEEYVDALLSAGEKFRGEVGVSVWVVGERRELRHCSFDGISDGRRWSSGGCRGCRDECRCLVCEENDEARRPRSILDGGVGDADGEFCGNAKVS